MQEIIGVTGRAIQHILGNRQHIAVQRATVDFLRMHRADTEQRDT